MIKVYSAVKRFKMLNNKWYDCMTTIQNEFITREIYKHHPITIC